ncbi:TPA: hypothetical protein J0587_004698, partial [Salmonella enterica subsp. enterica serovar Kentucky]|nr:hypothetical protein [Salmonella enterica subsp. enterica serovar Kentucky]
MKLIDILVEELPKCGGWDAKWHQCAQDGNGEVCFFTSGEIHFREIFDAWSIPPDSVSRHDGKARLEALLADDYSETIITREQYEAALAASKECVHDWIPSEGRTASGYLCRKCGDYNGPESEAKTDADGWIDWGGGECPVDTKTLVDIRLKVGFTYKSCHPGDYSWRHAGGGGDIIAYRLHQPQKEGQPETSEDDLNDCIGQTPAEEWNGEGLPPVGTQCEFISNDTSWGTVDVIGFDGDKVVFKPSGETYYGIVPSQRQIFRPIRSEADKKRDAMVN